MDTKDKQKFIDEFTERFVEDFSELERRYGDVDAFIEMIHIVSGIILTGTLSINDAHKAAEIFSDGINVDIDEYYKHKKENIPS